MRIFIVTEVNTAQLDTSIEGPDGLFSFFVITHFRYRDPFFYRFFKFIFVIRDNGNFFSVNRD